MHIEALITDNCTGAIRNLMVFFRTGSTRLWLMCTNVHMISVMARTVASSAVNPTPCNTQVRKTSYRQVQVHLVIQQVRMFYMYRGITYFYLRVNALKRYGYRGACTSTALALYIVCCMLYAGALTPMGSLPLA